MGVTAMFVLLTLEIGLLQEFAPPSNWPGGVHPGWVSHEAQGAFFGAVSYQGVIYCGLVCSVVFSLQWLSWKNPAEPGFGDTWRGAHLLVRALLFVALTVSQWSGLRHVETLHRHRHERPLLRRRRAEPPA